MLKTAAFPANLSFFFSRLLLTWTLQTFVRTLLSTESPPDCQIAFGIPSSTAITFLRLLRTAQIIQNRYSTQWKSRLEVRPPAAEAPADHPPPAENWPLQTAEPATRDGDGSFLADEDFGGKVDGQCLHARWWLQSAILDAQTPALHFAQAKVWADDDLDAARSYCLLRLSFAASCLSASSLRLAFLTDERQLSRFEASCCQD